MSDERDPRIDLLRSPPAVPALRPVAGVRPVVSASEAAEAYRRVDDPPPRPTDATRLYVAQVMSRPAVTRPLGATAGEAAEVMEAHGFRHLPIVGLDGRLAGLLSLSDLFRAAVADPAGWRARAVEAVMVREVVALAPEWSLHDAARRLSKRGHGGGPVLDPAGVPVGYLSARDLLAVLITRAPLTLWV